MTEHERSAVEIDKVAMAAESLGKSKTAAEQVANRLLSVFEDIERNIAQLAREGITVASIYFDMPILQAAWERQSRHDPGGPPQMETEEELVSRIRQTA